MLGAVLFSGSAGATSASRDDDASMRADGQRISHTDVPPHIRDELWRQHYQRFGMTEPDAQPEALNSPPRYLNDPKPVEVDGYRRADGTYVRPYRRRR